MGVVARRRVGTWLSIMSQETGCLRRFVVTSGIHYIKSKRRSREDPDELIPVVDVESLIRTYWISRMFDGGVSTYNRV